MVDIEIVVSRYSEKLKWISQELFNLSRFDNIKCSTTIYNKNADPIDDTALPDDITVVNIENVGREAHTYLYHIVTNYDKLKDITIFLPASCTDAHKITKTEKVLEKVIETKNSVISGQWYNNVSVDLKNFKIGSWLGTNKHNQSFNPSVSCQAADKRPFGKFYSQYFSDIVSNVVCYHSIFAISKAHILNHSVEYYKSLLECLSHHVNPEEGHYLERSWQAVFHPLPDSCIYTVKPKEQRKDDSWRRQTLSRSFKDLVKGFNVPKRIESINEISCSTIENNDFEQEAPTKKQKTEISKAN